MYKLRQQANEINNQMGGNLKAIRNEERYTMRALAERLGMPHSFIGKTEQSNRRLDVGEFIYYCKGLEVDPVMVFKKLVALTK